MSRPRASLLVLAAALCGCNQPQILTVDQISEQSIGFWTQPGASALPVFLGPPVSQDPCFPSPGNCTSTCDGFAQSCAPDACAGVLLDSLAPLSSMLVPELERPLYEKSCAQLRRPPFFGDQKTQVQLRAHDLGTLMLPTSQAPPQNWALADGRHVRGVLGGDFLLQFAAELRFKHNALPQARFFRSLAGSESRLANRGLSYLAAQAPGQLLGRVPGDQCELAPGLECDRPIAQLGNLETQKIMPPSRLQLDLCIAPPSCELWMQQGRCELVQSLEEPTPCQDWRASEASGASLILATSVPGIVMFSDSAARIFPKLDTFPYCDRPTDTSNPLPYCLEREAKGSVHVPGWAPMTDLQTLRVSSLAVLSGEKSQFSAHPCERWQRRMQGLRTQCVAFGRDSRSSYPALETGQDPQLAVSLERPLFQAGALAKSAPERDRQEGWLRVTILPASAPIVSNLRRSSGTIAAQADGLLGLSVFDETRVVLDFTEREQSPGIRVQCLEPQDGRCRSMPECFPDVDTGDASCCHGLNPLQLRRAVQNTPVNLRPHPCCDALSESVKEDLAQQDPSFCE